ncbi:hypothetical protein JKP88DRAFT_311817 [Tribonema minus]|uniref:AP2/ERF domain-containing protein n=1 Tax=Tribonema minus TaxID=303371 RepID=A0A835Z3I9_9STRA|nr:hypothetical protein JKP88DRAFT_311817 [Tribonema minus]
MTANNMIPNRNMPTETEACARPFPPFFKPMTSFGQDLSGMLLPSFTMPLLKQQHHQGGPLAAAAACPRRGRGNSFESLSDDTRSVSSCSSPSVSDAEEEYEPHAAATLNTAAPRREWAVLLAAIEVAFAELPLESSSSTPQAWGTGAAAAAAADSRPATPGKRRSPTSAYGTAKRSRAATARGSRFREAYVVDGDDDDDSSAQEEEDDGEFDAAYVGSGGGGVPVAQASGRRGPRGQSRFKGVCITRAGKWRAVIYIGRKQKYLGVYDSELQAARAYNDSALEHFGAGAKLNKLPAAKHA